jgi:hypothetical protein
MRIAWLLALTASVAALAACSRPGGANNAAPANVAAVPTNAPPVNAIAADDLAAAQARNAKFAKIFTPDILGANVAYLETITGPAFRTEGSDRTYKVGDCEVIVGVAKGKIANIGVDGISPRCAFPIAQYFAQGYDKPMPALPTFGDIKQGLGGHFDADCLSLCGNATAPVVSVSYEGSHADNFNSLYAATPITGGAALDAYEDWSAKLIAKHGQDYVVNGGYKTGDSLDDVAAKDFAHVYPTIVRVGQDLPGD